MAAMPVDLSSQHSSIGPESTLRDVAKLFGRFGLVPRRRPRPDRWVRYVRDALAFVKASGDSLSVADLFPVLGEDEDAAGTTGGHYFHQDLWAAHKVHASGVERHVDVGSRIDGFVAHCSVFTKVDYIDLRPSTTKLENITFIQGSILDMPFPDQSQKSVSSLHVIEHIGLGRYGDPIDPEGTNRALAELQRIVAPGGHLYIGCPIGRRRVCFNAHRVLAPDEVPQRLGEMTLESFSAVDDSGKLVAKPSFDELANADYACGLYHLRKR